MSKAKWAQLSSNLPDDQVEEDGVITQFGGLGACGALAVTLGAMGFAAGEPYQAGLNGWVLYPERRGLRVWMQITDFGDGTYLLGVSERRMFRSADRRRWFVQEFLVPFNEKLRKNETFTDVSWIDPNDVLEGGGAYSPADPSIPER
jgi:hypothetical protein